VIVIQFNIKTIKALNTIILYINIAFNEPF